MGIELQSLLGSPHMKSLAILTPFSVNFAVWGILTDVHTVHHGSSVGFSFEWFTIAHCIPHHIYSSRLLPAIDANNDCTLHHLNKLDSVIFPAPFVYKLLPIVDTFEKVTLTVLLMCD